MDEPFLGDIRHDYPPGTPLEEIFEFDIWDGERWVPKREMAARVYQLQRPIGVKED